MLRLRRKREPCGTEAADAVDAAMTAGAEAQERLASASEVRAAASRQAARERRTVISELRAMREHNHLGEMILGSVQHGGQ